MNEESSDARKSAAFAISSASPKRPCQWERAGFDDGESRVECDRGSALRVFFKKKTKTKTKNYEYTIRLIQFATTYHGYVNEASLSLLLRVEEFHQEICSYRTRTQRVDSNALSGVDDSQFAGQREDRSLQNLTKRRRNTHISAVLSSLMLMGSLGEPEEKGQAGLFSTFEAVYATWGVAAPRNATKEAVLIIEPPLPLFSICEIAELQPYSTPLTLISNVVSTTDSSVSAPPSASSGRRN